MGIYEKYQNGYYSAYLCTSIRLMVVQLAITNLFYHFKAFIFHCRFIEWSLIIISRIIVEFIESLIKLKILFWGNAYYIDSYKFINSSDFIFLLFNNSADAFKFPRKKSSLSFFLLYCKTSRFS